MGKKKLWSDLENALGYNQLEIEDLSQKKLLEALEKLNHEQLGDVIFELTDDTKAEGSHKEESFNYLKALLKKKKYDIYDLQEAIVQTIETNLSDEEGVLSPEIRLAENTEQLIDELHELDDDEIKHIIRILKAKGYKFPKKDPDDDYLYVLDDCEQKIKFEDLRAAVLLVV